MEMDQELEAKGVKVDRGKVIMETDTEISDVSILVSELMSRTLVMEEETDMQVAIFVSAINFFEMLIYFLPWYDKINPTFINLCKVLDISYRYMEEQVASVERNLNLDTAIEMLPYFEKRLGIRTIPDISYKQRRRQVQAVLNLMHKQTDEETIKELCSAFSNNNAGAEIYKTENPYVFEIRFVANGLPNNLEEFERMLRINMPADLDWKFTYTQKTWEEVSGRVRWRDLEPISWSEFNEYKG
ncbi:MAG: YmfQ family protein [Peptoniphilus sp.]|uniref:putative phage tail protein n=1 Tax=Peptoniphilus sp. TaxID=1971214 RepID=UPI0025CCD026|nr:putative phage tail protein [Peptoniphilus sp.]MCI5643844.1 YmfQ family protein [Peptoniphilus sp.]